MLKEKNLPRELWGEVENTVVYLLNRSLTRSLQGLTPLQVFGSIVHVKCTKAPQKKLED